MNREVEERIVAMYFDNKDFESNAKKTIDTLGQLKEGLDLEDSVKGFDTLDKAGKQLNLSRATQTVKTFKESVSGMQKIVKKAFDFGTAPLQPLINLFNTFEDYTKKFLGFDLAGKFVNKVEGMVNALTTAPISSGWKMYQENIDSLQTILSGTKLSYSRAMKDIDSSWVYNEGEHLDYVKRNLADLTEYANKTVYSLSDMTSNIGKFTNQGVDLDRAVISMEGIANATAKAGQGAQQASMAMYNISQAIGVGKMTSIDWKSIENANIATEELKDTFIETAGAAGKLVKEVDKDGKAHYWTVDEETGKKTKKSMEVTAENFRETLSKGWLDKETMLRTFQIFSGEAIDIDTLKSWGLDDEQIDKFTKMGQEALKAATEVRTFDKMMDALSESVQSGWAKSFEYIIGDVKESTDLWTRLNNVLDGVLGGMTERRNEILLEWRGLEKDEEGNLKRIKGVKDGREDLVMGFFQIVYTLKDIGSTISGAWTSVFGGLTGSKLREITEGFKNFAFALRNWFGVAGQSGTRLEKIQKGLKGLFSILKLVINRVMSGVRFALKFLEPLTDIFIELFSTVFGFFDGIQDLNPVEIFVKIGEGLSDLWQKIKNFFRPSAIGGFGSSPFVKAINDVWNTIKNAVSSWASDVGLDGLVIFFKGIYEGAKEAWEDIVKWFQEIGLADFFNNFWEWLKSIGGGAVDIAKSVGDATKTGIVVFINAISSAISTAWTGLEKWFTENEVGERIRLFGTNTLDWLKSLPGGAIDLLGGVSQTAEDIGLVKFINGIGEAVSKAWESVEKFATDERTVATWKSIASFMTDSFQWISDKLSGIGVEIDFSNIGGMIPEASEIGFVKFLNGISESLGGAWTKVESWFRGGEGEEGGEDGTTPLMFFTDTWGWIKAKFGIEDSAFFTIAQELLNPSGFEQFLETVTTSLDGPWKEIIAWFTADAGIKGFLADTYNWITTTIGDIAGFFVNPEEGNKPGFVLFLESIVGFFESAWASIQNWFKTNPIAIAIRGFLGNFWGWFTTTYEEVTNFFSETSPVTGKTQFEMVIDSIKDSISTAWSGFVDWLDRLGIIGFFQDAWGWIEDLVNGLFSGEGIGEAVDTSGITENIEEGVESAGDSLSGIDVNNYVHPIVGFIQSTWDSIKALWEDATDGVATWPGWTSIANFFGNIWQFIADAAGVAYDWLFNDDLGDGSTGFTRFLTDVWEAIKGAWQTIVGWSGWASIGKFFTDIWGWLVDLFNGVFNTSDHDENGTEAAEEVQRSTDVAAQMVAKAEGFVESITEDMTGADTQSASDILKNIFGFIGDLIDKFTTFIGLGSISDRTEKLMQSLKDVLDIVVTIVSEITGALRDVFVNHDALKALQLLGQYLVLSLAINIPGFIAKWTGMSFGTIGGDILKISVAVLALAWGISIIADVPQDRLLIAAGAVYVLMMVMATILLVIDNMQARASASNPQGATERVLGKLITWVGIIGAVSAVMALLPDIIVAFKDSNASGDDIMKVLIGVTVMVSILSVVALLIGSLSSKLGNSIDIAGMAKVMGIIMLVIVAVTAFMYGMGEAINALSLDHVTANINAFAETLRNVAGAITGLIGGIIGDFLSPITAAFGVKSAEDEAMLESNRIDTFMDNLQVMVDKFGGDFLYDLALFMNTMQHFSESMDSDKIQVLGTFGNTLADLGKGINSFYSFARPLAQGTVTIYEGDQIRSAIKKEKTQLEIAKETAEAIRPLIETFGELAENMPVFEGTQNQRLNMAEEWRQNVFTYITEMLKFLYGGMGITWADVGVNPLSPEATLLRGEGKTPLGMLLAQIDENLAGVEPLVERLRGIMEMLSADIAESIKEDFGGKELTSSFFDTMVAALAENKLQFDATPVVDAIIRALGLGENAIGLAIHDMVQNGINMMNYINGHKLDVDLGDLLKGTTLEGKDLIDIGSSVEDATEFMNILKNNGILNIGNLGSNINIGANLTGAANNAFFSELLSGKFGGMEVDENGMIKGLPDIMSSMYGMWGATDEAGAKKNMESMASLYEQSFGNIMKSTPTEWLSFEGKSLYGENGELTEEGKSFVGGLESYIGEIQQVIDNSPETFGCQITVTPVINMDNWPTEMQKLNGLEAQLPYGMARGFVSMPETSFGLGDAEKLIELRNLNNRVERTIQTIIEENTKTVNAVYSMGQRIDGLSRTITGMRLYLDTGLLVGGITPYIDHRMAQKQWIYGRTGVVSLEK